MAAAPHEDTQSPRVTKEIALDHDHPLLYATLLLISSLALCAPLLRYGAPYGADSESALMWTHGFATQLSQGDWYPRWLMDINRGAGSAVFYFYAPLPFYIGSLVAALLPHQSLNIQLAWTDWVLLLSSGITFFGCARCRVSNRHALIASVLYMMLPYHFETDLWIREDLGELTNYIWMPLVFHFTDRIVGDRDRRTVAWLSVSYALMVLSHLPSTLLVSMCLAIYLIIRVIIVESALPLIRFVQAIAIGTLASGIYWVPAIFSQQNIHAEAWWSWYYDFHLWFFPVRSLDAFKGDVGTRSFNIRQFWVISATTVMFSIFWLAAWRRGSLHDKHGLIGCAFFVGVAWFLMTPISSFIWEAFPPLAKVQFPSRLGMVVDLGTAVVASTAFPQNWGREWRFTAAGSAAFMLLIACIATADLKTLLDPFNDPKLVAIRDDRVRNGVDAPEYTTRWSPFDPNSNDNSLYLEGVNRLSYDTFAGTISTTSWRPRQIIVSVLLQRTTMLTVRQFYFPYWRAKIINGASLRLLPGQATGLINVTLPPGNYSVSLKLEPSLQERLGEIASCIGILMIGAMCRTADASK